jgi:3-hydroxybutyryl-CoA dehydrogenase
MGSGIAQVSAAAGFYTILFDVQPVAVEKARKKIEKDLEQLVSRQKITAEKRNDILKLLHFTSDMSQCIADVVIEAIIEDPAIKIRLFNELAQYNSEETIFASNTSSLSISELSKEIIGAHRMAGLHFFNPAPVMKLVEVVRAEQTTDEVMDMLVDLTQRMGKEAVICRDAPGFIVNRVARPYYIESLRLAEEGMDLAVIDRLLEGQGFRMGPFKLMDLIGNDINYAVSCSVYEQLGRPERLRPSPLQEEKVRSGKLGRKTGSGYFEYESFSR